MMFDPVEEEKRLTSDIRKLKAAIEVLVRMNEDNALIVPFEQVEERLINALVYTETAV